MNTPPPEVHDRESAVRFVKWCVAEIGLGYHPDTPFGDYVDGDGHASFSAEEAGLLDRLTDIAFEHCDPYEVGIDEFQQVIGDDAEQGRVG